MTPMQDGRKRICRDVRAYRKICSKRASRRGWRTRTHQRIRPDLGAQDMPQIAFMLCAEVRRRMRTRTGGEKSTSHLCYARLELQGRLTSGGQINGLRRVLTRSRERTWTLEVWIMALFAVDISRYRIARQS